MEVSHRTHLLKPATSAIFPRLINGTTVLLSIRLFPCGMWTWFPSQAWLWVAQSSFLLRAGLLSTVVNNMYRTVATSPHFVPADGLFNPVVFNSSFRLTWEVLKNTDVWAPPQANESISLGEAPKLPRVARWEWRICSKSLHWRTHGWCLVAVTEHCGSSFLELQTSRACLATLPPLLSFQVHPGPKPQLVPSLWPCSCPLDLLTDRCFLYWSWQL